MKPSRYNLIFGTNKSDEYVLYNTLSDAIFIIDQQVKDNLSLKETINNINEKAYQDFIKEGIVIEDDVDERRIYKVRSDFKKYEEKKSVFMITITYDCNLSCPYCFEEKGKKDLSTMIDVNSIIEFIKKRTIFHKSPELEIQLFGGEPFLKTDLSFKILDELKLWSEGEKIKLEIIIYTNGTICNEGILNKLSGFNIKYVQVTLDGAKEDHDKRRVYFNKKGSYEKIMETLEMFKKHKISTRIRVNVDEENYQRISFLLDDLTRRKFNETLITFGFIQPLTPGCSSYLHSVSQDFYSKTLPVLMDMAIERGFPLNIRPSQFYVYCSASTISSYIVDILGNVYKCAVLQGMEKYKIGKINREGELVDIQYAYYDWLSRDPLTIEKCKECDVLPVCGGGCSGSAVMKYGTYHINECFDRTHELIEKRIMLYLKKQYPTKFGGTAPVLAEQSI